MRKREGKGAHAQSKGLTGLVLQGRTERGLTLFFQVEEYLGFPESRMGEPQGKFSVKYLGEDAAQGNVFRKEGYKREMFTEKKSSGARRTKGR